MRAQTLLALGLGPLSALAFNEPWLQYPDDAGSYKSSGMEDDGWVYYHRQLDPKNDGYGTKSEVFKLKPVCETSEASPWVKDVENALEPIRGRINGGCSMNNHALAGSHCTALKQKGSGKISICTYDTITRNVPCKLVVMMTELLVQECKGYHGYDEEVVGGYIEWDYVNTSNAWSNTNYDGNVISWVVVST